MVRNGFFLVMAVLIVPVLDRSLVLLLEPVVHHDPTRIVVPAFKCIAAGGAESVAVLNVSKFARSAIMSIKFNRQARKYARDVQL